MQSPRYVPILTITVAFFAAFFAGCAPEPPSTIRIGINAWPGYEFLYLAQEMGFFETEGVDVRIVEFSSLGDGLLAFERGQVDALGCTIIEMVMARARSERIPKIIYVTDFSDGADVLLVQPWIKTIAELRGKRVGVELGSLGVYMLTRALESAGMEMADVEIVASDQISMEELFKAGQLDAIVSYPPISFRVARDVGGSAVFSSADIPGEVVDVVVMDAAMLKKRSSDAAKIIQAFDRALDYTRVNPEDACRIMGARENLSAEEFAAAMEDGIQILSLGEQAPFFAPESPLIETVKRVEDLLLETKQIPQAVGIEESYDSKPFRLATGR